MAQKNFLCVGFPDFVEFSIYKDCVWAYIKIEKDHDMTTEQLGSAILKLNELGLKWMGFTYELGYYDSVEDKTLEFMGKASSVENLKR